jgi:hypothetical protein
MTLADTRRWVYDMVVSSSQLADDIPVRLWLPGEATELPCYVVGRPDLDEGTPRSIAQVSVPVYALGRTLRDDDAQAELDDMADLLIATLWRPVQDAAQTYRLTRGRATVLSIAAVEVPAYTMTVVSSVQPC